MIIFGETVVRVRAGTRTDRAGSTLLDWSEDAVSRLPITRVSIQPQGTTGLVTETTTAQRNVARETWRGHTAPGVDADITFADRIQWRGHTYEVDGEPARWPDPLRPLRVHHVEWSMVRVTG